MKCEVKHKHIFKSEPKGPAPIEDYIEWEFTCEICGWKFQQWRKKI